MDNFFIITVPDGAIFGRITAPEGYGSSFTTSGSLYVPVTPDNNHYDDPTHYYDIAEGVFKEKTVAPYTITKTVILNDGVDSAVISGLPDNSSMYWPDGSFESITDGEDVVFTCMLNGEYVLEIFNRRYLNTLITITVTD